MVLGLLMAGTWWLMLAFRNQRQRLPELCDTHVELWVYSTFEQLPPLEQLMEKIVSQNDFSVRGQSPIGPVEGRIFSDVRFKIALVLRNRNPRWFELVSAPENISAESLSDAKSLVKVQFSSPTPVEMRSFLSVVHHTAYALGELNRAFSTSFSPVLYDPTTTTWRNWEEFKSELKADPSGIRFKLNVRVRVTEDQGFQSLGLEKVGIRDLQTYSIPFDQMASMREVFTQYVELAWAKGHYPKDAIERFGDQFLIQTQRKKTICMARILRVRPRS